MYGWRTLLYGTLLPGPQIARSFPEHLRALAAAGHEVGVHGYDHVYWHDRLAGARRRRDRRRAAARARRCSASSSGTPARAFAAPGWQCTASSLAAIDAAGLRYHSRARAARAPYRPVAGGRRLRDAGDPDDVADARRDLRPRRHRCGGADRVLPRAAPARAERAHDPRRGRGHAPSDRCSRRCSTRCAGASTFVRLIDVAGALDASGAAALSGRHGTVDGPRRHRRRCRAAPA